MDKTPSTFGDESALVQEIRKDAETKADRARRRAERDAKKLVEDAVKEVEANVERVLAAARGRAEREATRLQRSTHQEIKRRGLVAEEAVVQQLLDEALRQLADKRSYDYRAALARLAAAAIGAMRGESFVLHLAQQDAEYADGALVAAVQSAVGRPVSLSTQPDQPRISGGVVVRSADGHEVFDNSFEARLGRQRAALRSQLAEIIFPPAAADERGGKTG